MCGEFPADQLNRLIPSASYAEKLITDLKAEHLIRTHYRDALRGYRLTKAAKEMLLSVSPLRFQCYLTGNTETNLIRSEVSRRIRLHQKAETYLTLLHAGIPFYPDVKPDIFCTKEYSGVTYVCGTIGGREVLVQQCVESARCLPRSVRRQ